MRKSTTSYPETTANLRRAHRIKEVAEIIGISESSIRRLIKRGEIRAINKLRHILIPASEIERFLKVR